MQFRTALTEEEFEDYKLAKKEGFTDDEFNEMLRNAGRMSIDLSKPFNVLKSRRPVKRLKELEKFRQKPSRISDEMRAKSDLDLSPKAQPQTLPPESNILQSLQAASGDGKAYEVNLGNTLFLNPQAWSQRYGGSSGPSGFIPNPLLPGVTGIDILKGSMLAPMQTTSSLFHARLQGNPNPLHPLLRHSLFGRR